VDTPSSSVTTIRRSVFVFVFDFEDGDEEEEEEEDEDEEDEWLELLGLLANARGASGNVDEIVPFIVSAERSNCAFFGSVSVIAPLTDSSERLESRLTACAMALIEPLTVWASSDWRTPRTSIIPFTLSSFISPSRSRTLTSPLTVCRATSTPGGTVSS